MVTERLHLTLGGNQHELDVRYTIVSYKQYTILRPFNIPDDAIMWFTDWKRKEQCSVFDKDAPKWYIKLAALCDTIDLGGQHECFVRAYTKLPPYGDPSRRTQVEKFIVGISGDHRNDYINARWKMYRTLLDTGLYSKIEEGKMIEQAFDYFDELVSR